MRKLNVLKINAKHMFHRSLASVLVLLLVVACREVPPGTQSEVDLLSLGVGSSEPRPHASFNDRVAKAQAAGDAWAGDPIMVVRRFAEWGEEREGVWVMSGTGERPSRYVVIAIADGFLDDSVRGERLDVTLVRASDESWRIEEARVSWRCWPGRGHETYGTDPCD